MPPRNRWPAAVASVAALAIVFALVYATVHQARINDALAVALAAERSDNAAERKRLLDRQTRNEAKFDALLAAYLDEVGSPAAAEYESVTRRTTTRVERDSSDDDDDGDRRPAASSRPPSSSGPSPTASPPSVPEPSELLPGVNVPSIDVPDLPLP